MILKNIENFYLALLTVGIGVLILKNSRGTSTIIREGGQNIAVLTRVASGGPVGPFGYNVNAQL